MSDLSHRAKRIVGKLVKSHRGVGVIAASIILVAIIVFLLLNTVIWTSYATLIMQRQHVLAMEENLAISGMAANTSKLSDPYYPSAYKILAGSYVSGTLPDDVKTVDDNFFITKATASIKTQFNFTGLNPQNVSQLNFTIVSAHNVSNPAVKIQLWNFTNNRWAQSTEQGYSSYTSVGSKNLTIYAHQETTSIAGISYYSLKSVAADKTGTTLSTGRAYGTVRFLLGRFLYPLNGTQRIEATTWKIYYRASLSSGTGHCDVDILIRKSGGGIRSTIASNVATGPSSGSLSSSFTTVSGTYSFPEYNVMDQTDYLEVDFYGDFKASDATYGDEVQLRIDDNSLASTSQTRIVNLVTLIEDTVKLTITNNPSSYIAATSGAARLIINSSAVGVSLQQRVNQIKLYEYNKVSAVTLTITDQGPRKVHIVAIWSKDHALEQLGHNLVELDLFVAPNEPKTYILCSYYPPVDEVRFVTENGRIFSWRR